MSTTTTILLLLLACTETVQKLGHSSKLRGMGNGLDELKKHEYWENPIYNIPSLLVNAFKFLINTREQLVQLVEDPDLVASQKQVIDLQAELLQCKKEQLQSLQSTVKASVEDTAKAELQKNLPQQDIAQETVKPILRTVVQEEDRSKSLMVLNQPEEEGDKSRLAKLEAALQTIQGQVASLTISKIELQAELEVTTELARRSYSNSTWSLVRTQVLFANLEKLKLHQTTPSYIETIPTPLPENTRAVIISVFCNFWNSDGHAYLNMDIQQEGNEEGGVTKVENTHYKVYANTFYYEVFVPWDSAVSDRLVFTVTNSYQTGGDRNWYRIRMVGYVTA